MLFLKYTSEQKTPINFQLLSFYLNIYYFSKYLQLLPFTYISIKYIDYKSKLL